MLSITLTLMRMMSMAKAEKVVGSLSEAIQDILKED